MRKVLLGLFLLGFIMIIVGCNPRTTGSPTTTGVTTIAPTTTPSNSNQGLSIALNPGVDTVEVGEEFIDAGVTAYLGDEELNVTVLENTVDTDVLGAYVVRYMIGHEYYTLSVLVERVVVVIDSTAPTLMLNPGVDTIKVGKTWEDAGVMATDNYFDEVTVTVEGVVDTNNIGTYTITYRAVDELGNESTIVRIVDVIQ
jgi:hypothetical protein